MGLRCARLQVMKHAEGSIAALRSQKAQADTAFQWLQYESRKL